MPQCLSFNTHPSLILKSNTHDLYITIFLGKQIKVMESRNRDFKAVRARNLTQNSSTYRMTKTNISINQSHYSKQNSFTSSFLKKPKADVCVTCVNKNMNLSKKQQQQKQRKQEIQKQKQQMKRLQQMPNLIQQFRYKQSKQADQYNKSLISTHLKSSQSQKTINTQYMSQILKKEDQYEKQEKRKAKMEKEALISYRNDLKNQYKNEIAKKQQQRQREKKDNGGNLPLMNLDKSKIMKEYSQLLKKQMSSNNIRKQAERMKQKEQQKRILQLSQRQSLKYTEYAMPAPTIVSNPQVFQQLKTIDFLKKTRRIEELESKNMQRMHQIQRQRELIKSQTQKSIKTKREYQRQLKQQIKQKQLEKNREKEEKQKFQERTQRYTQDQLQQSRLIKPCEDCHHLYDQKCF